MAHQPAERSAQALATFTPAGSPGAPGPPVLSAIARIGQGPQNDIVLDDDTVSTHHARLEYVDGSWLLTDLDSRNGTYIDGIRLAPGVPTPLPDGAAVAFGAMNLGFQPVSGAEPAAAAAAREPSQPTGAPAASPGFRLPVWVLVLILLIVALVVFFVIQLGGDPPVDAVPDALPAMLEADPFPYAA